VEGWALAHDGLAFGAPAGPGREALTLTIRTGSPDSMSIPRRASIPVRIERVTVGGRAPIVVQSMTNTDTADIEGTAQQIKALARAGSELVRITVNEAAAAAAVPRIRDRLAQLGVSVPLIGDFHFNGHKLLREYPECAEALAKYRINPGNVGRGSKRDPQFAEMIEIACRYQKPVRIGVNWGSLDQDLLTRLMDENNARPAPLSAQEIMREAVVASALESGSHRDLFPPGGALRLAAAPRPHRGRHGQQGHRGFHGGHGGTPAAGHRRHHPRVTHARARRGPHQ
jgi:hypothetical protein